jgi:hypothetical protein
MELFIAWSFLFKEYLTGVLTRPPAMLASEAASITPANWLAARSGKPARKVA